MTGIYERLVTGAIPADAELVVTSPSSVIFSTAMLTGRAPCTSMRSSSAPFAVLFHDPEFFEDFVELLLVGHGKDFLRGDLAVVQFDTAVGESRHDGIVRDHHNGASLLVEFAQQAQHDFFVLRVEIAGRLVGQDDFGIVDQRARDADALLFAARQLRGYVMAAVFQARRAPVRRVLLSRRSCCGSTARA